MKLCKCGGIMRRIDTTKIKSTGETKIRLRCRDCNVFESHYYDEPPALRLKRQPMGRPGYVDR
jgi:hypothetical protein